MIPERVKEITIEYLLETPAGKNLEKAMEALEIAQEKLYSRAFHGDDRKLTVIKAGTMLVFGVLKRLSEGKKPADYTEEDWKQLAESVTEYAVMIDGRDYNVFVFDLYARYIDYSARALELIAGEEKTAPIKKLSTELVEKSNLLQAGKLAETQYVEDCLWISFEAMFKLLSVFTSTKFIPEYAVLAEASSECAFEALRLLLFRNRHGK